MLERLLFISFALAFWIKLTSKDGLFCYYQNILVKMRKHTHVIFWSSKWPCTESNIIKKFYNCIPCRLFRVSICITVALYFMYGFQGNQMYFYPFLMAGLGTSVFRLIGE
jgi:hypothetical protein